MRESLALGLNVDFSVLVRRGLDMVLASPQPVLRSAIPCNLTTVNRGRSRRCITCGLSGTGPIVCPTTGLEAES